MKLRLDYKDTGWRYWAVSWCLIVAGLAGWRAGFLFVTALSAWQIIHYALLEKSLTTLPVQVRTGFFLLTLAGLWPPLGFVYWLPAVGLLARTTVNYCFLARVVALMPWNRTQPFSLDLLRRTIFSPPVDGSILDNRGQ